MKRQINVSGWNLVAVIVIMLLISQFTGLKAFAANPVKPVKLVVDGKDVTSISKPIIKNDRTLVHVRYIAEELGAKVEWNGGNRTVEIEKDGNSVLLKIDSLLVSHWGEDKDKNYYLSDVAPIIIEDLTYVPLRLISNALGIEVDWDGSNRRVIIDSSKTSAMTTFFDMKISSVESGQVIAEKTNLQIELNGTDIKKADEIKYLLVDPETAEGIIIGRGKDLTTTYNWIPYLHQQGEKVLVAALYDKTGNLLAGDAVALDIQIKPKVKITGIEEGQIVENDLFLDTDTNFMANYVKYEINNLDKETTFITEEQDPQGPYKWSPMFHESGRYSIKAIAYDRDHKEYFSDKVEIKIEIPRRLGLGGVTNGSTITRPVKLSTIRNFHVNETEYVLRDLKTKEEKVLFKSGYGDYKWFPGPELSGTKELFVRVKDTGGVTHESHGFIVNLIGTPKIFLEGVGPKQIITEELKLNTISNIKLDKVDYILTNSTTGAKKVIGSKEGPLTEYLFKPEEGHKGSWNVKAIGKYGNKAIETEEIPIKIYLGKTYGPKPIVEKSKFLEFASKMAKDSWKDIGMSAALQTAQSILETGWGQSAPVDKYSGKLSNNLFGIKGKGSEGSVISNTWEVYNGTVYRIDAEFRAYNKPEESWKDHKDFLFNSSRYEPVIKVMHDSTQAAWALKRAGYATDPKYAIKLIELIKQYNLQELDKMKI